MSKTITQIKNINAMNYQSRDSRHILNIVVGMTNNVHSGAAYAQMYRTEMKPRITYNYVIDKNGNVYQTIPDDSAGFAITCPSSEEQVNNKESISICFMPTWNGESMMDDYDYGSNFPKEPIQNQEFLLTKIRKIDGNTYPTGLYVYNGSAWEIVEAFSIEDIKRPYESNEWTIEPACEDALRDLIKWLQIKYNVGINRVYRVYDFFRTYNPAPYLNDYDGDDTVGRNDQWNSLLDSIVDADYIVHQITPEKEPQISEEYKDPTKSTTEIIEQYGPEAGVYTYKCINPAKCPYRNILMTDKECILTGLDDNTAQQVQMCPYRKKVVDDKTFTGNSIVPVSEMPGNKFTFELGIHDTLNTEVSTDDPTKATITGNLWHITNTARELTWSTYLEDNCDEFHFEFYNKDFTIDVKEGFNVGYWINTIGGFNGNIFKIDQNSDNKELLQATCYGFMRYLQSEGWNSFSNKTASQIFDEICNICNVPHRVIDASSYICQNRNCFGESYYETIKMAIYDTLVHEKQWYIIQSNFGTLEFRNILNTDNIKPVVFSESSAILSWNFSSSIEDSANMIVTYDEGEKDEETGKAQATNVVAVKDESTILEWGRLQKVIKNDKSSSDSAVMNISAEDWLTFYNSPRRTIKLECLGVPGIMAGNIIYLEIYNVVSIGAIKGCLVVDECTHNISGGKHTMNLTCEVVQDRTLRQKIYNAYQISQEENKIGVVNG